MEAIKLSKAQPPPFELSLRIRHPSIDPAEISRELKLEARHSFKAGEPRALRSGGAKPSLYSESYWLGALDPIPMPSELLHILDLPQSSAAASKERFTSLVARDLDMALSWCVSYLSRRHATFIRRIRAEGGEVRLLVTMSVPPAVGFTLTPELGRALSESGIALNFEFANT